MYGLKPVPFKSQVSKAKPGTPFGFFLREVDGRGDLLITNHQDSESLILCNQANYQRFRQASPHERYDILVEACCSVFKHVQERASYFAS